MFETTLKFTYIDQTAEWNTQAEKRGRVEERKSLEACGEQNDNGKHHEHNL